jgi:predicted SAM-dependent methyltransferase
MDFENVDAIYSCHCLEHLEIQDCQKAFSLFNKWLKQGGILRFSVPSLEIAINAYHSGSDLKFLYGADFKGYYLYDTPCERFNFFMKEWEHKIIYDLNQLSLMLREAGFSNIQRKEANQSAIPNFHYDRFISESLYVECIK